MNNITVCGAEAKKGAKIQNKILEKIRQLGFSSLPPINSDIVEKIRPETVNSVVSPGKKTNKQCSIKDLYLAQKGTPFRPEKVKQTMVEAKQIEFQKEYIEEKVKPCKHITSYPSEWKVSESLEIICQERNQIPNRVVGRDTLVLTAPGSTNPFRSATSVEITEWRLTSYVETAQITALWKRIYPEGRMLLICSNNTMASSLLAVSCILAATKLHRSASLALKYLIRLNNDWLGIENLATAQRYADYFDLKYNNEGANTLTMADLHQVILYAPSFAKETSLVLESADSSGNIYRCQESYKDSSFTIYSNFSWSLAGETQIKIKDGDNSEIQLLLQINTMFYKQGVFRFHIKDLLHKNIPAGAANEFFMDLIFVDRNSRMNITTHAFKEPEKDDIGILSLAIKKPENRNMLEFLLKKGYPRKIAQVSSQLSEELPEAMEIAHRLSKYKNSAVEASSDKPKQKSELREEGGLSMKPLALLYGDLAAIRAGRLQEVDESEIDLPKPKAIRSFLKRGRVAIPKHMEGMPAHRPFHWIALTSADKTVFNEMKNIVVNIDRSEFEKAFCRPSNVAVKSSKPKDSYAQSVLQDSKRIFLVSLSLRHLELMGIPANKICDVINHSPEKFTLQDLLNAEQVFPKEQELMLLKNAAHETLSVTERAMLHVSKDTFAQLAIKILIFERKSREEFPAIRDFLENTISAINTILGSDRLKVVLKFVLELGNMINCSLNKAYSCGYRLESLRLLGSYRGPDGKSLRAFLLEALHRSNMDLVALFAEFQVLEGLPAENLDKVKERINLQVAMYNYSLDIVERMPKDEAKKYSGFIKHAMRDLQEISKLYKECFTLCSVLKVKFSEDKTMGIIAIFQILKEFLDNLKEENLRTLKCKA